MSTKQDRGQAARALADLLRKSVDYASAKVDIGNEYTWLDYARGKDIARFLRAQPELMEQLVRPAGADRTVDDMVEEALTQLVQRKLLLACDRKFKKPKPGKTKLVKFPRTLEPAQPGWREDMFYAWTYSLPRSASFYVLSALLVLAVFGATLFPIMPYKVRLGVLYSLTGVLMALLGFVLLRYVVFCAVWVLTGYHLWFCPRIMDEKLPLTEVLFPLVTFERPGPGKGQYLARAATLLLLLGGGYALHRTAPDADAVTKGVKDARNSLFEYLDMMAAKEAIAGANATADSAAAGAGTRAPGGAAGAQGQQAGKAGAGGEPKPEARGAEQGRDGQQEAAAAAEEQASGGSQEAAEEL